MSQKYEAALFKVESIHHIHGDQCLCGFKSAVSRDRTKHIMEVTLEAAAPHLKAETWDEGYTAGVREEQPGWTKNPYGIQP